METPTLIAHIEAHAKAIYDLEQRLRLAYEIKDYARVLIQRTRATIRRRQRKWEKELEKERQDEIDAAAAPPLDFTNVFTATEKTT